jgi:hypothetical protein
LKSRKLNKGRCVETIPSFKYDENANEKRGTPEDVTFRKVPLLFDEYADYNALSIPILSCLFTIIRITNRRNSKQTK